MPVIEKHMVVAELVGDAIRKALDMRSYSVNIVNFGNAIEIIGRGQCVETAIYIRIENRDGLSVNFSNVLIAYDKRRKGMFTSIVESVSQLEFVDNIIIGGVCTDEMHNWVIKNQFKEMMCAPCDYIKHLR